MPCYTFNRFCMCIISMILSINQAMLSIGLSLIEPSCLMASRLMLADPELLVQSMPSHGIHQSCLYDSRKTTRSDQENQMAVLYKHIGQHWNNVVETFSSSVPSYCMPIVEHFIAFHRIGLAMPMAETSLPIPSPSSNVLPLPGRLIGDTHRFPLHLAILHSFCWSF